MECRYGETLNNNRENHAEGNCSFARRPVSPRCHHVGEEKNENNKTILYIDVHTIVETLQMHNNNVTEMSWRPWKKNELYETFIENFRSFFSLIRYAAF